MPAIHFIVKGKVQGVFYRETARKHAEELQLTGWIRNNADKTVEGVACGTEEALQQFTDWCHKGPILARVTEVVVNNTTEESFQQFEVKR